MNFLILFTVFLSTTILASPLKPNTNCTNPLIRKEWRTLTSSERRSYISAIQCLHTKPSTIYHETVPGVLTAFEDFIWAHKVMARYYHWAGHFFPWHRLLVWRFETALREQCGYRGAQPYWDMTKDVGDIENAEVFSTGPDGFGGNGEVAEDPYVVPGFPKGSGGGCVRTGVFAKEKFTIHLGENFTWVRDDHCVRRNFNPEVAKKWVNRDVVGDLMKKERYTEFWRLGEGGLTWEDYGLHMGAHYVIGGIQNEATAANADPIFYTYHAAIDYFWDKWQRANPEKRMFDIGGPTRPWGSPFNDDNTDIPESNVTLALSISLDRVYGKVPIEKLMDTLGSRNGVLCYKYE